MIDKIKISVIIPIYLVERYLYECVESVQKQSYKEMEIILVDDGSTDASSEICDELALRDKRIKVIHKENGGLSDARNAGMQAAEGDYLIFLDGDDFWDDSEALMRLVDRIRVTKADVLNFSYKKYFEDTGEKLPYFYGVQNMPLEKREKEQQLAFLTERGLYIASACNKIINRKILNEELFFRKGVYSEDIEWCVKLMIHAKSMDFVCENFYCYRQRHNSISHTIDRKKCEDLSRNILRCFHVFKKVNESEKKYVGQYIAYQYGTFFAVQARTEEEQVECIELLAKYHWILSYHCGNRKLLMLHICCKVFGMKITCKLVRCIFRKCG